MPLPLLMSAGFYWPLPTTVKKSPRRMGWKPAKILGKGKVLRKDGRDQQACRKSGGAGQNRCRDRDLGAINGDDRLRRQQCAGHDRPWICHRGRRENIERL